MYKKLHNNLYVEQVKRIVDTFLPKSLTPPMPAHIVIDISSRCNLACPLCPTGNGTINLKKDMLTPADFRKFIKQFPHILSVSLFNWGEPFLNAHIFDILDIAREYDIKTDIDTNFSLHFTDEKLLKIARSGLSVLRVSLDGASQKTYGVYRHGGDFELAFSNMKRLRKLQKKAGLKTPRIYWKFLVNKFNENELEKAKQMAKDIDVRLLFDYFLLADDIRDISVTPGQSIAEKRKFWLTTKKQYLAKQYQSDTLETPYFHRTCPWLFSSLVIHPDGNVLPCCYAASEESSMGNVHTQSVDEIWNSPKYQYARSLFIDGATVDRVPVICEKCPIYLNRLNRKLQ